MPATILTPTSPILVHPLAPAAAGNDNATLGLERDLEAVIAAAAAGSRVAQALLEPAIRAMARSSLVYLDDVDRVTKSVLLGLDGVGKPMPGRAAAWLAAVVRDACDADWATTSREQWEGWDPPAGRRKRR